MTKEQLQQYKAIKAELRQIESRLDELEAPLYSAGATPITGMPMPPSRVGTESRQERLADQTMELREYYQDKHKELAEKQLAIERGIDALKPIQRMVLRHRYIEGLSWEEVCTCMGYSWRQIHRIHAAALEQLSASGE